jgi:plastocyanin
MRPAAVALFVVVVFPPAVATAQGNLDRPPNISGGWVVRPGTVQFNFLHRFVRSPGPVRKVTSFPTFVVATAPVKRTLLGFSYATNSTLAAAYPNEWEFFGRLAPLEQGARFPFDVAAQVGYNLAAEGPDGELSLARRLGALRLVAGGRLLTDPRPGRDAQFALAGGASLKLGRHFAVQGDLAHLSKRNTVSEKQVAWSAGLAVAIPNTPHTLSLHATNTNTATLQGASRGADQVRYGFEFTIPITLARYFGRRPPAPPPEAPIEGAAMPQAPGRVVTDSVPGPVFVTAMQALQFVATTIEISAGTTVEWKNDDPVIHTVTADNRSFDSGELEAGRVWRYLFVRPGSYPFHCTTHPFMRGTVVVQ